MRTREFKMKHQKEDALQELFRRDRLVLVIVQGQIWRNHFKMELFLKELWA